VLTLYQAEWCPYSHRVRARLTELGIDFVAKQVAAEKDERLEMKEAIGSNGIPTLVTDDGKVIDDCEEILGWLNERYEERVDANRHRAQARHEVPEFFELHG
jgi:glutathione S-transferase